MPKDLSDLEKQVQREISKIADKGERALLREYRRALDEIRGILGKLYEKYAVDGELTLAEMAKFSRLRGLEKQIAEILGKTFSRSGTWIDKNARVQYEQAFYRHEWAVSQAVGSDIEFGLLRPDTIAEAVANPMDKIGLDGMRQNGILRIRREVTQGLIRGDSYPAMAREIKAAFDTTARDTLRIVRTEGQRAQVLGQQDAYAKAEGQGVDMVQVWDATLDNRTRPEHAALDGKEATYEDDGTLRGWYVAGIGWVTGPLQSGVPEFDINCRCRITGKIKGYEPKSRRIRDEGIVAYTTFTDWAKEKGLSRNVYGQSYDIGG